MTDIVILFCATMVGFCLGKYLESQQKQTYKFFCDLQKYVALLKLNVNGRCLTLQKFNDEFSQSCSNVFADFLKVGKSHCRLSKNQGVIVANFLACLSVTFSEHLVKNLDYCERVINAEVEVLSKQIRNGLAQARLGVLLGVMVGILLI